MGTSLFIKNQKNSMMQKMAVELMPSCKEPIGKEPYRSTKIDTIIFDPLAARAIVADSQTFKQICNTGCPWTLWNSCAQRGKAGETRLGLDRHWNHGPRDYKRLEEYTQSDNTPKSG
jgi:hypothetical protein